MNTREEVVEVCSRIEKYCREDKSEKAILLNGRWGSGKSYFVRTVLKTYLEDKTQAADIIRLCYVSLYGVSRVEELNKRLYCEYKGIGAKKGLVGRAKVIATTLTRIGLDYVGFDPVPLEKAWEELQTVNVANLLIVFDDVERSNLNIVELFGYINNLCELDGAKVLVVAEEEKIREKAQGDYNRAREKTIGDVIKFESVGVLGVSEVIGAFSEGEQAQKKFDFADASGIEMIEQILLRNIAINLRTLRYACQKYSEIMDIVNEKKVRSNKELRKAFFFGLLGFSASFLSGHSSSFPAEGSYSNELGLKGVYPLFRPCYEYVVEGKIRVDELRRIGSAYRRFFNQSLNYAKKSKSFRILTDYTNYTDEEIKNALVEIKSEIKSGDIPYCAFGTILMNTAVLQYDFGFETSITELTDEICEKLKDYNERINYSELFMNRIAVSNDTGEKELKECCRRIEKTISPVKQKSFELDEFIDTVSNQHSYANGIVYWIDQMEWHDALVDASPRQLNRLVEEIGSYYAGGKISDYPKEEKDNMIVLLEMVSQAKEKRSDRMGKYHIERLEDEMEAVLSREAIVLT